MSLCRGVRDDPKMGDSEERPKARWSMTQGTKLGLLVSLALLITILLLLSDHVANNNDVRPAELTSAGTQVAQGITTPGTQNVEPAGLITGASDMEPIQPIPIVQEMMVRQAPPVIDIGPARTGELELIANNSVATNMRVAPPVKIDNAEVTVLGEPRRVQQDPLLQNEFVPVAPGNTQVATVTPPVTAAVAAPKSFQHKAQSGDTVSKMARKYYGLDTKSNRDLIVGANRSLKGSPDKIEVGKTYTIPVKPGTVSAAQAAAAIPAAPVAPVAATVVAPVPAVDPAERTYVVKSGDNLWKIAKEQCNNVNAVDQIKKMNADVLKNGIDLKVGSKLRLPAKKS